MPVSNLQCLSARRWKILYRSAIGAANTGVSPAKINEAEQAVILRAQELNSATGPEIEIERDALEDALYALHALRNTIVLSTAA